MTDTISRRGFFSRSFGVGAGLFFFKGLPIFSKGGKAGTIPIIVTDHTNKTGQDAMKAGWDILVNGGSALDAVEKSANIIEVDPEDYTVGYGGLPNEEGVVQLDSCIMDGKTYNAGAVACLENIKTPSSVARVVMEQTDHVLLVGKGALEFAKKWGFKEENLLTEKSRKRWLKWKQNLSDRDDWGPPDHLKKMKVSRVEEEEVFTYGTTNLLAVDQNGDISGITSTSGLSWKIPGRVGDSPIIGAGLYVDNEVGAAGATGRGEDVIKSCASYYIVMRMREGRSPQQACEDAIKMIVDKYKKVNPNFFPGEKFVAINKKGEYGCAYLAGSKLPRMCVANRDGINIHTGRLFHKRERRR
jgi:N4-(beta-N-acetylglucosaminyl)-L-asparaginase